MTNNYWITVNMLHLEHVYTILSTVHIRCFMYTYIHTYKFIRVSPDFVSGPGPGRNPAISSPGRIWPPDLAICPLQVIWIIPSIHSLVFVYVICKQTNTRDNLNVWKMKQIRISKQMAEKRSVVWQYFDVKNNDNFKAVCKNFRRRLITF